MTNSVTLVPAAPSEVALKHFESELTFETDCWDTHEAMQRARIAMARREARRGLPGSATP
jgi:hypothetical protein